MNDPGGAPFVSSSSSSPCPLPPPCLRGCTFGRMATLWKKLWIPPASRQSSPILEKDPSLDPISAPTTALSLSFFLRKLGERVAPAPQQAHFTPPTVISTSLHLRQGHRCGLHVTGFRGHFHFNLCSISSLLSVFRTFIPSLLVLSFLTGCWGKATGPLVDEMLGSPWLSLWRSSLCLFLLTSLGNLDSSSPMS